MIKQWFEQLGNYSRIPSYFKLCIAVVITHLLIAGPAFSQNSSFTVTGTVKDSVGEPIANVSIAEKGKANATMTNKEGNYKIAVSSPSATLVFSNVSFDTEEVPVNNKAQIDVSLKAATVSMNEVVVTALGIARKAKSLTYSTQTVSGEDLTKTKDVNVMNNLVGKVSGVQINRSASGPGGSISIILRGAKSLRNNQPLYVVDGVPITNTGGTGSSGVLGGQSDRGDILSTLNADDIQSINVLKGSNAAALYGSQGANGAIMITTKKGASGVTRVDINSMATMEAAAYGPKLQFEYGQTPNPSGGLSRSEESWGPKGSYKDHVEDFFQKGLTFLNSVALSGGSEKMQNYFSFSNTSNRGILPSETFKQNTVTYRNTTKFFNDKLTFDGSIMYADQKAHNRAVSGLYYNPIPGLYMFPRGLDFSDYENNYEALLPSRNLNMQRWFNIDYNVTGVRGSNRSQNPFWVINRNPTDQSRQNIIAAASLKYALTDWLTLSARGTLNKMWNKFERRIYAGTQSTMSGSPIVNKNNVTISPDNGRYMRDENSGQTMYGDLLLSGHRNLSDDLELTFTAGTSINDIRSSGWSLDQTRLNTANVFLLNNIYQEQPISNLQESFGRQQIQAVFASANFGYKDLVFLDLTGRNDWSSTLANTPNEKKGFFYYSTGLSTILNEYIKMPGWVNLAKLRFSYAETGNGVQQYTSMAPPADYGSGVILVNNSGIFENEPLRPEMSKSLELGFEGRFINNRLNLDIAVYKNNTRDQFFSFPGLLGTLNTTLFINAGDIQNKGIEIALGYDAIKTNQFTWNTSANFTLNRNKIVKLNPKLKGRYSMGSNYNVLREGGTFGDLWAGRFLRNDQGQIMLAADSTPRREANDGYIGTNNPKAIAGWVNSFSYGNFNLSFTIDGRFGGSVISNTMGFLNSMGYSQESADARNNGGVDINAVLPDGTAVSKVSASKYYHAVANMNGILEGQLYDATNIRLRELMLGYKIPVKNKVIRNATVSLVGRNLFFFKNNAPYDPELVTTTAIGGDGYDIFGLPATRSYGLNLRLGF